MYSKPMKSVSVFILLILLYSCQTTGSKHTDNQVFPETYDKLYQAEDEKLKLISIIKNTNKNLETFKGIGNLKLINNNKSMNTRAAWIGTHQGNFRVEIFGFPGQSAASYSNDGQYSYLYFHLEDRLYIIDSVNPSLEKILTISITSKDLNSFLSGRVPIYEYDINKTNLNISDDGYVLNLKKGCFGNLKKIYFNKHQNNVQKVEIFNLFGSLIYRAELSMVQTINGYTIPFDILITNDDGNRLHIHIDKYWTDVTFPVSSFTLTHPK